MLFLDVGTYRVSVSCRFDTCPRSYEVAKHGLDNVRKVSKTVRLIELVWQTQERAAASAIKVIRVEITIILGQLKYPHLRL